MHINLTEEKSKSQHKFLFFNIMKILNYKIAIYMLTFLWAHTGSAFEINLDRSQLNRFLNKAMVQDLAVSVPAMVPVYAICSSDRRAYVDGDTVLEDFTKSNYAYYTLVRNVDGTFTARLQHNHLDTAAKDIKGVLIYECHPLSTSLLELRDINDNTNMLDHAKWLIQQGFK